MTMEESKDSEGLSLRRWISILVTVLLVLSVLLCLYVAIQVVSNGYASFGGYMMFRVVTGSMEPTIPTGALMISQQTDIDSIQVNDIICFRTQEAQISGKIVTHRVVESLEGADGGVLLRTQGDANLVADSYFVDRDNFIGKVIWHTGDDSVLASIFSFFSNGVGFLGCIVLPCILLAGLVLRSCIGNIRRELETTLQELENNDVQSKQGEDALGGMTEEEYKQLYAKIYAELMEELMECAETSETE